MGHGNEWHKETRDESEWEALHVARAHAIDFGLLVRNCPIEVELFDVLAVHNSAAADDGGLVWLRGLVRNLFD